MSAAPIPPLPAPIHELDFAPLAALVAAIAPTAAAPLSLEPMSGGASTRRYYRVALPGSSGPATAVAMFVPEGGKPEEVQKHSDARRWPFLEVRDLLERHGVDVPMLLAEDTERGWLLLEDLGDDTLASYLTKNPNAKTQLYTTAVHDLVRAQKQLSTLPDDCIVSTRAFDEDLLRWELHHFREWGLEARGISLTGAERATFDEVADRIARRIASWPRGFVHRDYQSRNLMVRPNGRLAWIDFQDALLGPQVYDLVALLNDSYQEFTREFVEARLDEYAAAWGFDSARRAALGREFDVVTVQRKLKDAGRFVFIDRVKQNPSFLPFVTPTIRKAMASIARLTDDPDMRTLASLLRAKGLEAM